MKFRHLFMAALAAVVLAACEKEIKGPEPDQDDETQDVVVEPEAEEMEFTAETTQVKTALNSDGSTVVWSVGDKISVWDGYENREFTASAINGSKVTFKGQAVALEEGTYYAVYPYSADNVFEGSTVKCTLPAVQTAVEGGFDKSANVSVASSSAADKSFIFKNVCGLAMFKLDLMMSDVTEVWFSGTSALAGAFSVDLSADELSVVASEDVKSFSLTGVEAGNTYYVPVLPSDHTSVSFTLVKGDSRATIEGTKQVEFKSAVRTDFGNLCAEEFVEYDQFEINVLEYGSTSVTEGSEIPAEGIDGEIYMNVNAADGVEWYMTVTRNGSEWTEGQVGTDNAVSGTGNRWFKIPEAREAQPVAWSVTIATESNKVAEKSHTINFTQKSGVFRLDNFGGYTDAMPAVVNETGTQKDMYIIVYATEGLQWTGTVQKNGEAYQEITGTGRLTQDSQTSSHVWIPNNTTTSEIVWTVTVTTEADVAEKTQTLTITQAASEASAFSTFEFIKLDGSGLNVTEGSVIPASGTSSELYMNMNASSDVEWSIRVYKDNAEYTGGQIGQMTTGTGSRYFTIPENTTTSVINWKVVAYTDNANVQSKEFTLNFTQAAGEASAFSTFEFTKLDGSGLNVKEGDEVPASGAAELYMNMNASSDVEWSIRVYKDNADYTSGQIGQMTTGTGSRWFKVPENTTTSVINWKVVAYTDNANVQSKEFTLNFTQAAGDPTPYFTLKNVHINGTDYSSDAYVVLTGEKDSYDAYINVESNVDWTWVVYKDEVKSAEGTATGSPGGRLFWMPYSETEVEWRIVVSTEAEVDNKEQTITITQRNS